jgi:ketosteroid isomerase-like protein
MSTSITSRPLLGLAGLLLATMPALAEPDVARTASTRQAIELAVLETNAAMTKAANSLDADAFFEFISDSDQTQIIQDGNIYKSRDDALQAVKRGMQRMSKVDRHLDHPRVTVLTPNIALLTSDGSVTAVLNDGRVMDSRFVVSLLFVLEHGHWKVLHGHYSAMPNGLMGK